MKAAAILSTLALAVVLCSAGKHHGKHFGGKHGGLDVTIVKEVDPRLEGYGYSGEGYTFKKLGGLQYSFLFQEHDGVFATGSVIEQGDRCGLKGIFSCGKGCGAEKPVCKAVFTKCGVEGAKCRSNEVCVEGACYPYVCEQGLKCYTGARTVCEPVCATATKTVCHDEKVYVCGNHGRRLAGGSGYNSHGSGAVPWGGAGGAGAGVGVGVGAGAGAAGSVVTITQGGSSSGSGAFFDPSLSFASGSFGAGAGGFGAGCGFITKQVCEEVPFELCEDVCALKEGFFCTEEICGSDPEMVACGRGYCRLGDMCYQPSCDHACIYNKKHFCW